MILFDYELNNMLYNGEIILLGDMYYNQESYMVPAKKDRKVFLIKLILKQDIRYLWE